MNQLRSKPFIVMLLGLLIGPLAGLGWYWHAAGALLRQAAVKPVSHEADEQRAQGWDFWTIQIDSLQNELKEERARQEKQAEQLELRAGRLATEQAELERLRQDLLQVRAEIEEKIVTIRVDEQKNLRTLAQTYTNLTPRSAVAIIRELDDRTVVKILSFMKPDVIGPIFEEMAKSGDPEDKQAGRAAALSEQLRLVKATPQAAPP